MGNDFPNFDPKCLTYTGNLWGRITTNRQFSQEAKNYSRIKPLRRTEEPLRPMQFVVPKRMLRSRNVVLSFRISNSVRCTQTYVAMQNVVISNSICRTQIVRGNRTTVSHVIGFTYLHIVDFYLSSSKARRANQMRSGRSARGSN